MSSNRQPAGAPNSSGGQFAQVIQPESVLTLPAPPPGGSPGSPVEHTELSPGGDGAGAGAGLGAAVPAPARGSAGGITVKRHSNGIVVTTYPGRPKPWETAPDDFLLDADGQSKVDTLQDLIERAMPVNVREEYVISRQDALRSARPFLAELTDDEFYDKHWFAVEAAAIKRQRFALDEDGDKSDGAIPKDLCGVDIEDFRGFDDADRPGESGSTGFDWPAVSQAVAEAWQDTLRDRVTAAVRLNEHRAAMAAQQGQAGTATSGAA